MDYRLSGKKRDLFIIIFSVIVLAFLIAVLANIIFESFFYLDKRLFTATIIVLLFLFGVMTCVIVISGNTRSKIKVFFPYIINRKEIKFEDIPDCVPSVHARVGFDLLSKDAKKGIIDEDNLLKWGYRNNAFYFLNQITQEVITSLVLGDIDDFERKWERLRYEKFPYFLTNNIFIKKWFGSGYGRDYIVLPKETQIEFFGKDSSFIYIHSKYGTINFHWSIDFCSSGFYSEPYIERDDLKSGKDFHDFAVTINLETNYNIFRMYSKELESFVNWLTVVQENLRKLDWSITEKQIPIRLLKEIKERISNKDK